MKPTHPKYNRLAGELRRARTARDGTLKANREMRKHIKALEERNADLEESLRVALDENAKRLDSLRKEVDDLKAKLAAERDQANKTLAAVGAVADSGIGSDTHDPMDPES